jgi:hypothetical protein
MTINTEGKPTNDITVQGIVISIPAPFEDGDALTANAAAALNQTYAENIRNNMANHIKKEKAKADEAGTELDPAAIQAHVNEYVSTYEFGVRRGGGAIVVDPVEKEALSIAMGKVKESLKGQGYNLREVGHERIKELAVQALDKYPQLREQAAKIVEMRSEVGSDSLDLDLG